MPNLSKSARITRLTLESIATGGQTLGTLPTGQKCFVWGGVVGEEVEITLTKQKRNYAEGVVTSIIQPSPYRILPADPDSYLTTSPWQMLSFDVEQHYKAKLIDDAFALHHIKLAEQRPIYTDNRIEKYRNKVEFSWYGAEKNGHETLDLAFFRRGSKGKIPIDSCSLLPDSIMQLAHQVRDSLHTSGIPARSLKTLVIRTTQSEEAVWQLYVKEDKQYINPEQASTFTARGGEVIYSDPRSPASKITKRLMSYGNITLEDTVLGIPFHYAAEGFFQVNIPVYEQVLSDMATWIPDHISTVDLYSGVGSIGLTIGGNNCTLVEIDENAVREMKRNIARLGSSATAVLASSETALEHITSEKVIIVDPPRAGLHKLVIDRLLETKPQRIIYLSCNPVTQARDVALLSQCYSLKSQQGYNFFPRTPHIENLVVLDV